MAVFAHHDPNMKTHLVFACCLTFLSVPAVAQFDNMVTTDDGRTLLFESRWQLAATREGNLSKIYRYDGVTFSLVASPVGSGLLVPPSMTNPLITGDGQRFGYTSYPGCSGLTCSTAAYSLVLPGAALPAGVPAAFIYRISHNSRYVAAGTTVIDRFSNVRQTVVGSLVLNFRWKGLDVTSEAVGDWREHPLLERLCEPVLQELAQLSCSLELRNGI
jgi:hypothetical protein